MHLHGGGSGGHVDHLNELYGRRKDPFELTDTRGTAPPERQGSKTCDESHDLSFHSVLERILGAGSWAR